MERHSTSKNAAAEAIVDFYRCEGFAVVPPIIDSAVVEVLRVAVESIPEGPAVRKRGQTFGVRNLLQVCEEARRLASSPAVRSLVEPILGPRAFAVRGTFFDKVPGANWSLFWHQDNVICVTERREVPGFVSWSRKSGVWHVQPPAPVLAQMLAVRVHLDDCGPENGPLRVLPGSHREGWLDDRLDEWKSRVQPVVCVVPAGGAVLMCPLTLHASAPASRPVHRRVIHLEFASADLPDGLQWTTQLRPTHRQ